MLKAGNHKEDICTITWLLTNVCNFSCSYCPDDLHSNTSKFPSSYSSALKFIKKIADEKNKKGGKVHLDLTGGEVTLWPLLIEFLGEIKSLSNISIEVITNGSRSQSFWKKFCKIGSPENISLLFSYHPAFCDPNLFYRNLEIVGRKYNVLAVFMLVPEYFHKTKNLFKKVSENLPIDCTVKLARDKFHDTQFIEGYNEEMLQFGRNPMKKYNRNRFAFKKERDWPLKAYIDDRNVQWKNVVKDKRHRFKGWKCLAGSRRFFINFDGDIYSCSRFVGRNERPFCLGNIYQEQYEVMNKPIICPQDYCPCLTDAVAPKYSPEYKGIV